MLNSKKILVTGGSGFIGTNLISELRGRGHEVMGLDILHDTDPQSFRCDVREYRQLRNIFKQNDFDFVYHLAAEYGRHNGEAMYENLWETNVIGTKNILRLQEEKGFKHIFFSSAEVYGDYDGVMSEDVMEKTPIVQMNDYAITKWAGEIMCLNSAREFGTKTVRIRPVNAYGPHDIYSTFRGVIPIFCYNALMGKPFVVYRGHYRIFDFIADTVRTVANIVDNFIPGEAYNVGSDENWLVEISELAALVLKLTGRDESLVIYKHAEPNTTMTKQMDYSKIRRDFAHRADYPLEKGLLLYIDWMKSYYRIAG